MRWKVNHGPMQGDKREIKRFSFFPQKLDDNYVVWLERYYVEQKYYKSSGWHDSSRWSQSTQNKILLGKL